MSFNTTLHRFVVVVVVGLISGDFVCLFDWVFVFFSINLDLSKLNQVKTTTNKQTTTTNNNNNKQVHIQVNSLLEIQMHICDSHHEVSRNAPEGHFHGVFYAL